MDVFSSIVDGCLDLVVKRPSPAVLRRSQVECWYRLVGSQVKRDGEIFTLGVGWLVLHSEDGDFFTNYWVLVWLLIY